MSNLPLKALPWIETSADGFVEHTAQGAGVFYRIFRSNEDIKVIWVDSVGGSDGNKLFKFLDEAKHWIETDHYSHKMQPYVNPDSITDIANRFKAAKPEPTTKDLSTQIGCLFEEVVELLEGLGLQGTRARGQLHYIAGLFKANTFGDYMESLSYEKRIEIVDACCDINVTSVGVMQLLGGVDVLGAQREVIRSNNSKMVKGKFEYDENGKIAKPESYSKPDLTPFVKQGE